MFSISNSKLFVRTPGFLVMALDGFSALEFVPSVPKILAEIKTTIFYTAFRPSHSPIRAFHTMPLKTSFSQYDLA